MQKDMSYNSSKIILQRYFQLQESKCSFVSTLIKFNKNNEDKGGSKIEILVRDKDILIFLSTFFTLSSHRFLYHIEYLKLLNSQEI